MVPTPQRIMYSILDDPFIHVYKVSSTKGKTHTVRTITQQAKTCVQIKMSERACVRASSQGRKRNQSTKRDKDD